MWSGFDHRRGDFGFYEDNLMPSNKAVKRVRSFYETELEKIVRKEVSCHKKEVGPLSHPIRVAPTYFYINITTTVVKN